VGFLCPYGTFEASDGVVMIAAATDEMFARLCEVLDVCLRADDRRFATNSQRLNHRAVVEAAVADATRERKAIDIEESLNQAGVPCARVLGVADVAEHPQTRASGLIQEVSHPEIGDLELVGLPLRIDGERPQVRLHPPLLGEHDADFSGGWSRPREERAVSEADAPTE
jgi:crotonobetainyl-CoA:carnitine CoA-transferase CaiB-like acyl-CoA transferase